MSQPTRSVLALESATQEKPRKQNQQSADAEEDRVEPGEGLFAGVGSFDVSDVREYGQDLNPPAIVSDKR